MNDTAFSWVLSIFTNVWSWLGTYNYHGVSLSMYIVGLLIISVMIGRLFR